MIQVQDWEGAVIDFIWVSPMCAGVAGCCWQVIVVEAGGDRESGRVHCLLCLALTQWDWSLLAELWANCSHLAASAATVSSEESVQCIVVSAPEKTQTRCAPFASVVKPLVCYTRWCGTHILLDLAMSWC